MATAMPKFLEKLEYDEPIDPNNTGFMYFSGGVKLFEMFAQHPDMIEMFQANMEAFADMRLDWTQIYDTRELFEGFEVDEKGSNVLFVDIGGGKGIDINRLLKRHPDVPTGRIFLQDLPQVIAAAKATVSEKVVCQPHDFFKEQPVIGEYSPRAIHLKIYSKGPSNNFALITQELVHIFSIRSFMIGMT